VLALNHFGGTRVLTGDKVGPASRVRSISIVNQFWRRNPQAFRGAHSVPVSYTQERPYVVYPSVGRRDAVTILGIRAGGPL
jgi:hypothetical protein